MGKPAQKKPPLSWQHNRQIHRERLQRQRGARFPAAPLAQTFTYLYSITKNPNCKVQNSPNHDKRMNMFSN